MYFTEDILKKRFREVKTYIKREAFSVFPFRKYEVPHGSVEVHNTIPDALYSSGSYAYRGDKFIGFDDYLWLTADVTLPHCSDELDIVGFFDFGKTGDGLTSGFEALLYVNGRPFQGVDTFHNEVLLNEFSGQTINLTFLLWTGLWGGPSIDTFCHELKCAEIAFVHKATQKLYYRLWVMHQGMERTKDEYSFNQLIDCAAVTCSMLRWDSEDFDASVNAALEFSDKWYSEHKAIKNVTVNCVGHTHIDVAWLWRLRHTREKAMRSFSTALRLMEEYPEFLFLQSQPQLYDYIKKDSPELYDRIKERIMDKRWEADGAMWLEADCNISSGESLSRQLIHGIGFMKREFDVDCKYLWLPDVFGYSWALPQLLKLAHIDSFITSKISWNEVNRFPYDLFTWRGIDGSEILANFITVPDCNYRDCIENKVATYNGMMNALSVSGTWEKFNNKELSCDVLLPFGYGDGGGGVTREMLEMRRELDNIPSIPAVKPSTVAGYLEKLHSNVKNAVRELPVWDGELYLEGHRGTYTNQALIKKYNRRLENLLFRTEWLNTVSLLNGGKDLQQRLNKIWEIALRNQFHDIIPGSAIKEVYADSRKEYEAAFLEISELDNILSQSIFATDTDTHTVVNPSPFASRDTVFIEEERIGQFITDAGTAVSSQRSDKGYLVFCELEPLSCMALKFLSDAEYIQLAAFTVSENGRVLETPYYTVWLADSGDIISLYDKQFKRRINPQDTVLNGMYLFDDRPIAFDAWNIDPDYKDHSRRLLPYDFSVMEVGGESLKLNVKYCEKHFNIEQSIVFYSKNRRIDLETMVDWHESHRLLKAVFPVDIRSITANFDIQYGYASRPTHRNTSWEQAKFETVAHKWADISESDYGVAVLNDCKYGYSIEGNVITLSLLKSAKYPDDTSDMGIHTFTYSLLPHTGALACSEVIAQANALNNRLFVVTGRPKFDISAFKCDNPHIQIDAIKSADDSDGLIIRLHEAFGSRQHFCIETPYNVASWERCDLLGKPVGERVYGRSISCEAAPFELHIYRVKF